MDSRVGDQRTSQWAKADSLDILIKFYWNTAMPICVQIIYGCFHATMAELSCYSREYDLQNLKYLLSGPLQQKTPALRSEFLDLNPSSSTV